MSPLTLSELLTCHWSSLASIAQDSAIFVPAHFFLLSLLLSAFCDGPAVSLSVIFNLVLCPLVTCSLAVEKKNHGTSHLFVIPHWFVSFITTRKCFRLPTLIVVHCAIQQGRFMNSSWVEILCTVNLPRWCNLMEEKNRNDCVSNYWLTVRNAGLDRG